MLEHKQGQKSLTGAGRGLELQKGYIYPQKEKKERGGLVAG